jgi:peptidoglycan/LPS O-acetylase OafA/YrhL
VAGEAKSTLLMSKKNNDSNEHSGIGFRGDIQGLRAIAVLAVMIFHANSSWLPAGFIGVDIFFVISGYIISSVLLKEGKALSWSQFYWARVKRIIPAYLVMLSLVCVVSALLLTPVDFSFFKSSLRSALLFVSNQYYAGFGDYFAPGAHELPLLHTWSLAIEMQFYLFLPIIIYYVPRQFLALLLGVLSIAFFTYAEVKLGAADNQRHVYFSLLARVPEFLVGALITVSGVGRSWSPRLSFVVGVMGAALLLFSLVFIDEKNFPGFSSSLPCIAVGMIIASRRGVVNNLLALPLLVIIGALSYSLYLWHWPVLAFMRYYLGQDKLPIVWICSFVLLTYLLAWASYRWVETPLRSRLVKIRRWVVLSAITACMIAISLILNPMIEKPLPREMTRYSPPDQICHGRIIGDCLRGDHEQSQPVLIIGDSHAAQLNEFFDVAGVLGKFSARVITASNCVPIAEFDVERIPDFSRADCRAQIAALKGYIDNAKVIVIAAMWQWHVPSKDFMAALADFLDTAAQRDVKVIVLAQVPMFNTNLVRVKRFAALGLPVSITENSEWAGANQKVSELANRYRGVQFLDFSRSEFFRDAPFVQGQLIYMDDSHLNELGARQYGLFAVPFLKAALAATSE